MSTLHGLKRTRSKSLDMGSTGSSSISFIPPSKKLKFQTSFSSQSPFPNFSHPTPSEALEVFNILSNAHETSNPVRRVSKDGANAAEMCGNVTNVLEALIATILSQNTSGKNSSRAKAGLDAVFGRNNFAAISDAPTDQIVESIRCGGLASKKAVTIQNILRCVKERYGDYSLQHLGAEEDGKRMSNDEIMKELLSYDGVGPKTASCVLLFCLDRDSFAVDTHVFRLSKLLGWAPEKADRVLTQAHLEIRIPDELKYGLHVLMIRHGRTCKGCKTPRGSGGCILKKYLREKISRQVVESTKKLEMTATNGSFVEL